MGIFLWKFRKKDQAGVSVSEWDFMCWSFLKQTVVVGDTSCNVGQAAVTEVNSANTLHFISRFPQTHTPAAAETFHKHLACQPAAQRVL